MGEFHLGPKLVDRQLGVWREQAVVADLHEAGGQHMLKESADELQGIDGEGARAGAGVFFLGEAHLPVVELEDAMIGDGDLEHVRG